MNLLPGLGSGLNTRIPTTPPEIPGACTRDLMVSNYLQPGERSFLTLSREGGVTFPSEESWVSKKY